MQTFELDELELKSTSLVKQWKITIDTPVGGVDQVVTALGDHIPLVWGPYDNSMYINESGKQRFRALEGSHAGAEGTVQQTAASQIIISIPQEKELLAKTFDVIFDVHVNEEPGIMVEEVWASRSKVIGQDNPNRYWNRDDAEQMHGEKVQAQA